MLFCSVFYVECERSFFILLRASLFHFLFFCYFASSSHFSTLFFVFFKLNSHWATNRFWNSSNELRLAPLRGFLLITAILCRGNNDEPFHITPPSASPQLCDEHRVVKHVVFVSDIAFSCYCFDVVRFHVPRWRQLMFSTASLERNRVAKCTDDKLGCQYQCTFDCHCSVNSYCYYCKGAFDEMEPFLLFNDWMETNDIDTFAIRLIMIVKIFPHIESVPVDLL